MPKGKGRLDFIKKLKLVQALVEHREPGPNAGSLLAIDAPFNDVRNQVVHNLKHEKEIEKDIEKFIGDYHKLVGIKSCSNEALVRLKNCIVKLCKHLDDVITHFYKLEREEQKTRSCKAINMFNFFKRESSDEYHIPHTRITSWLLGSCACAATSICDVLIREQITSKEELENGRLALCCEIGAFHASYILRMIMQARQVAGQQDFAEMYQQLEKAICEFRRAVDRYSDVGLLADSDGFTVA